VTTTKQTFTELLHKIIISATNVIHKPLVQWWIHDFINIDQSINQSINLYRAIVQRRMLQCGYAESKRNVLRRILNVLTDEAVRQFSGREFQNLGAAT